VLEVLPGIDRTAATLLVGKRMSRRPDYAMRGSAARGRSRTSKAGSRASIGTRAWELAYRGWLLQSRCALLCGPVGSSVAQRRSGKFLDLIWKYYVFNGASRPAAATLRNVDRENFSVGSGNPPSSTGLLRLYSVRVGPKQSKTSSDLLESGISPGPAS
jgi:hypothetical protein